MPVAPEVKHFYGYHWRTVVRPRILARAGGKCERCRRERKLSIAHLDRTPGNDDDANLAALCEPYHKTHDYLDWAAKSWRTRVKRKDAGRPLLANVGALYAAKQRR